jgi:hypothetical protein
MSSEIEAAAADGIGSFFRPKPKHALPVGTPCPNCAVPLEGPWCHACGQKGEEYHRSIGHLIAEAVEGLTHFDGRLWQTLPKLIFRPAALTKSFLEGHRAPQVPPFRIFLIVLVLVFATHGLGKNEQVNFVMPGKTAPVRTTDLGEGVRIGLTKGDIDLNKKRTGVDKWMVDRLKVVMEDPAEFRRALGEWGHRLAILFLPMAAGILGLLFINRRRIYLFDHLIFSMHSLSFQGLLLTTTYLLTPLVGLSSRILLLAAPVHLFFHMRGVYRSGVFMTLLRMAVLAVGSIISFMLIMTALFFISLSTLKVHG